ncbi:MAG TPA: hypothetical protein VMZ11_00190 [Mycobacteriales bacterium]|nr:hypothetical protein [Mycobacteriales bacterium]
MDSIQVGLGWVFVALGAVALVASLVAAVLAAWFATLAAVKKNDAAKKAAAAGDPDASPQLVAESTAAQREAAELAVAAGVIKDLMATPVGLAFVMAVLAQALGWAMLRGGEALQIVTFVKPHP